MIQIKSSSKGASKAIVDITGNELKAGSLARLFQDGAKAIVLREDDRVLKACQLWRHTRDIGHSSESKQSKSVI